MKQPIKTLRIRLFMPLSFLQILNTQAPNPAAGTLFSAREMPVQERLEFREIIQYREFVNEKSAMAGQFERSVLSGLNPVGGGVLPGKEQ